MENKVTFGDREMVRMEFSEVIATYYFMRKDREDKKMVERFKKAKKAFANSEKYIRTYYGADAWKETFKKAVRGSGYAMETYWIYG